GLADLWDATGSNRPLPAPWNAITFNDPRVQLAFLNYCRRAITYFNPDYLTIGIEVNQLMAVNPALWSAFLTLQQNVYRSLKALYPSMPIMVSMTANELLGYVDVIVPNQDRARADMTDVSDFVYVSVLLSQGANTDGP